MCSCPTEVSKFHLKLLGPNNRLGNATIKILFDHSKSLIVPGSTFRSLIILVFLDLEVDKGVISVPHGINKITTVINRDHHVL